MKNVILITGLLLLALGAEAGTFNMVQINPNTGYCDNAFTDSNKYVYGAGDLKHFAKLNGLLYFVGTDQPYNDELWVTDGTQQGTHKVKEINPNGGAHIGDLRILGNKLVFLANETTADSLPTSDFDIYTSDGTAGGTTKVYDLNADFNTFFGEQNAGVTNGKLVFCTNTDVMVSDATATGTRSLAPISIVSYIGSNGYCDMNGSVYFIVNSDIWKSDGTIAGTKMIKSVSDSTSQWNLAFANSIKAFDNKLYVVGAVSGQGEDLFAFEGTEGSEVTRVLGAGGSTYPGAVMISGDALWFTAYDTIGIGQGLYKLASSSATPLRVAETYNPISISNNKVYYSNADNNGYEVIDAMTNAHSSFSKGGLNLSGSGFAVNPNQVLSVGNKTIYLAYDSATGQQVMCITDGTSAGIRVEMPSGVTVTHPFDYQLGCGIIDVFDLTYYDGKIVVPANFNNAGRELWFYEEAGLVSGIQENAAANAMAIYPNPANEQVTIDLTDENLNTDAFIKLTDIEGRLVSESKVTTGKVQVSIASLQSGTYIATVIKGNEAIQRSKIVVVH